VQYHRHVESGGAAPCILAVALDRNFWSDCPGCFTLRFWYAHTHWPGGWLCPRADL